MEIKMNIKNLLILIIIASISVKYSHAQTSGSQAPLTHGVTNICNSLPNLPFCGISPIEAHRICVSQCKVEKTICYGLIVQGPMPSINEAQLCEDAYQSCVDACH